MSYEEAKSIIVDLLDAGNDRALADAAIRRAWLALTGKELRPLRGDVAEFINARLWSRLAMAELDRLRAENEALRKTSKSRRGRFC
jgi:hypothetical protein